MNFTKYKATFFTVVASVGVIATMISAIHETPKVNALMFDEAHYRGRPLKRSEKTAIRIKGYLPTELIAAGTIVCIIASNICNKHQQAAMAQAYLVLSRSFEEYKAAVETATDDAAMQRVLETKPKPRYSDPEKQAFYIEYYDKIFESTLLEVTDAEFQLNRKLILKGYVMVNDFLEWLGLEPNDTGRILGWDYTIPWVDFDHGMVDVDGMDCFVITPRQRPWIDLREFPLDE